MDGYLIVSFLFYIPVALLLYNVGSRWAVEADVVNAKLWGVLAVVFHVFVLAYLYNRKTLLYNARELAEAEENGSTPVLKRNFLPYIMIGVVLLAATARFTS